VPRIQLPIADPCHENWDAMEPVEGGRFCGSCNKQVYDLSSMTEDEARGILREHASGKLCVRYLQDAVGNIRFRPARPARAAALALAMAACTPHQQQEQSQEATQEEAQADRTEKDGADEQLEDVMGGIDEVEGDIEPVPVMGEAPAIDPETPPKPEAPPRPRMGRPAIPKAPDGAAERDGRAQPAPDEPCDDPKSG
jgi:hypothetical protein